MAFSLSAEPAITSYSATERKLFGLLAKAGKPVSTEKLAAKLYANAASVPYTARDSAGVMLRRLASKIEINSEPFKLHRKPVPGNGRNMYWSVANE